MSKLKDLGFQTNTGNQNVNTPEWIIEQLEGVFGAFDFDPCPANPDFDGLAIDWKDLNFVNPPYKNLDRWIVKATAEAMKGHSSVMLVPWRPNAVYWWEDVYLSPVVHPYLIVQPFRFKGYRKNVPFPMCVLHVSKDNDCPRKLDVIEFTRPSGAPKQATP